MITYKHGNIFDSQMECLVNPVNTVGVMGKGLALEFKRRYPWMFCVYKTLCNKGLLTIGYPRAWTSALDGSYILLFPTKRHWKGPSLESYIEAGLRSLVDRVRENKFIYPIHSIAFPAIGCGLGGLDFETQVRPLLDKYLADLPIDVEVYIGRGHGRR